MRKFIVVIFPNETTAYEGTRAFKELDAEGSLTLYGMTVVAKETDGNLSVKQDADQGPLGLAVGTLTGGLIGLLGGPVGVAIGLGGGALIGSVSDLFNLGVSADFIQEVSQHLIPGRLALVADVDEEWITPLDTRMEALGGIVVREWRADVEDELYLREVNARKAELAQLKAEFAQAREENRAKVKARMEEAQAKLDDALTRAQTWLDQRKAETEAKANALQEQAAKARDETRAKIEMRITVMREDYHRRAEKLKQARELAKEALRP
ncbi:MAG TPA: DUF1269 domain-containing protein [Chthonomonadaceae bacterium]|nr:DUF1269 domain-containing protein [Chthonomonadaceae bacterium]